MDGWKLYFLFHLFVKMHELQIKLTAWVSFLSIKVYRVQELWAVRTSWGFWRPEKSNCDVIIVYDVFFRVTIQICKSWKWCVFPDWLVFKKNLLHSFKAGNICASLYFSCSSWREKNKTLLKSFHVRLFKWNPSVPLHRRTPAQFCGPASSRSDI